MEESNAQGQNITSIPISQSTDIDDCCDDNVEAIEVAERVGPSEESVGETQSTASSNSSFTPTDGEFLQLLECAEEDSAPLTAHVQDVLKRQLSNTFLEVKETPSWYGHRLTKEEAMLMVPPSEVGGEGLVWYATIIPDEFLSNGKLKRGLNKRDFDLEANKIKPRRPSLLVTASDFFASLTKIDDPSSPQARYIFHGVLNGWPSLRAMELVAIEQRRDHHSVLPTPKEFLSGQILWWRTWGAEQDGKNGVDPKILHGDRIYRAKLCCPKWTSAGWSKSSPGFCFWFEKHRGGHLSYGTDMLTQVDPQPLCTSVHMIAHRYATARETPRDLLTYHTVCLLEWDHQEYCTVVELAFLNGMGGYKGKSNWYHDRDAESTQLYEALPPEMICPWKETRGEIRCFDVESKNLEEFLTYTEKYRGKRFIDPRLAFSHIARLTFRSKASIAQYLLNYIGRDSGYAELKKNCQTFAADFCAFLAGKRVVQPFHPVSRIEYQNR